MIGSEPEPEPEPELAIGAARERAIEPGPEPAIGREPELAIGSVPELAIEPMAGEDWPSVERIYAAGIAGGNATFEPTPPSWEAWLAGHVNDLSLVARPASCSQGAQVGEVLGWAALSPASARSVYRGVAEVSIYVDPRHARQGVGRALLSALIERSERAGFWTLSAGIFPENSASVALHERCGFELLGTRRRVGQMPDGRWRDVLLYERRSPTVGRS
jgi:L-amino acid N-acyltransferase YncA